MVIGAAAGATAANAKLSVAIVAALLSGDQ
jgi:hypothetical protein